MSDLGVLGPAAWAAALLLPLLPLLFVLSALVERSGPIRLRHWVEGAGGELRRLYESGPRFEAFRYLLNLGAKILPIGLFVAVETLARGLGASRGWLWALGVVAAMLAATELGSRSLLLRGPEEALRRLTWLYRFFRLLFSPLVPVLAPVMARRQLEVETDEAEDAASEEEIEAFIDVGTREGILDPEERELVWGVVDFGETQVRSVMTPRIDMVCAPAGETLETLATRFVESSHSRIPIYRDSIDTIVGILHIRDVLAGLSTKPPGDPLALAQAPLFVPETKRLDELLRELQARRQQMAIVVDEFGGTAGLVTVEDLIEEIVGEIADEHDVEEPENRALPDGSLLLDGRAHIERLEEEFDVRFEDPAFETVGGLVSSALGYLPQAGESVTTHGLLLTVERADDRRVLAVRVQRAPDASEVDDA